MPTPLKIWTNYTFPNQQVVELAIRGIGHSLIYSSNMQATNLAAGTADPTLRDADVILGQPDPTALLDVPRVKWVHLTSAGYDRYDRPDLRKAFSDRGAALTNSSAVYEEPCAQHALSMMLSLSRQLPQCQDEQRGDRAWLSATHRLESYQLIGQTVVILSYGSIARRLIEMLSPFRMNVIGVRREVRGDEKIKTVAERDLAGVLPLADHVVNILPGGAETKNAVDADKFSKMKPTATFYNIGRGSTVDQTALLAALNANKLRAAYLDVTDPEPLPVNHPLWSHPHCWITPHTAGGSADEFEQLAKHFLENLNRFATNRDLVNRVI